MSMERWWNDNDRGKSKQLEIDLSHRHLGNTNPTWTGLKWNTDFHDERPTTNRFIYGGAYLFIYLFILLFACLFVYLLHMLPKMKVLGERQIRKHLKYNGVGSYRCAFPLILSVFLAPFYFTSKIGLIIFGIKLCDDSMTYVLQHQDTTFYPTV